MREYIWLPDAGYAGLHLPLAVVSAAGTYYVHADHLSRPVRMTDTGKATVWSVTWDAWGSGIPTGPAALDARLPGQWFQIESGLHYNWHRQYDPSLGRYTQPDPLGFVDGPSVYGYGRGNPLEWVDFEGEAVINPYTVGLALGGGWELYTQLSNNNWQLRCVKWWPVLRQALLGASLIGPHYWYSSAVRGGGIRIWKHGPGVDWHILHLTGAPKRILHYHRGTTKPQLRKHRPWEGW